MTILPGSLDYLYTGGVIEHIPFEAYDYPVAAGAYEIPVNPMNGVKNRILGQEDYMSLAKQGRLFNATVEDAYVKQPVYDENYSEGKSYREQILESASKAKQSISSAPSIVKGLVAFAIVLGLPLFMILSHKKPLVKMPPTSGGSKWNPINWFKK